MERILTIKKLFVVVTFFLMGVTFLPVFAMADYHPHMEIKNISESHTCVFCHKEQRVVAVPKSSDAGLDYNPLHSRKQLELMEAEQLEREASYQNKMWMFIVAWIAGSLILGVVLYPHQSGKTQSDPEKKYKGTGYKILTADDKDDLQKTVNEYMKRGWCLSGSIQVSSDAFGIREYVQAVFKDEPAPVEPNHVDQTEARG
jgi:hypothetical protein